MRTAKEKDHLRRLSRIAKFVLTHYHVSISDVRVPNRSKLLAEPRMAAMYILRVNGFGASEIGRFLRRHHTTVIKDAQHVRELLKSHPNKFKRIIEIEQSLPK